LVGLFGGCNQSIDSAADTAEETSQAPPRRHPAEVADEPQPGDDDRDETDSSAVRVARAESRIPHEGQTPAEHPGTPGDKPPAASAPQPPEKLPAAEVPLPLDHIETADLTMPQVSLTEHHAAMCKVRVGDKFPDLQLSDLAGKPQSLAELQGKKLTLVVFWNAAQPTALEELADLARYYQARFGDQGLSIVAINSGDEAQRAGELAEQAGADYPVLRDTDGLALAQVATAKLPRTYLVDPAGKVLWFDLEYSPTTRRDLVRAIRYQLAHQ
jgi:peroxiredoxin